MILHPRELHIVSMQRSGTHAVMEWIATALSKDQPVHVFNDYFNVFALSADTPYTTPRHGALIIPTFEDRTINDYRREIDTARANNCLPIGNEPNPTLLVVLRDPFNLFASRLAGKGVQCRLGDATAVAVECWKDHARWALAGMHDDNGNGLAIQYNRWFQSPKYREEVAKRLSITPDNSTLLRVPEQGGGSSFDGRRFHGRADQMATCARWKQFISSSGYWCIFDDKELLTLALDLFPDVYAAVEEYLP